MSTIGEPPVLRCNDGVRDAWRQGTEPHLAACSMVASTRAHARADPPASGTIAPVRPFLQGF